MARPIVYDLTYVVARLDAPTPTGIERVDAAYARHFVGAADAAPGAAAAVHYGLRRPHRWTPATARRLMAETVTAWRGEGEPGDDPVFQALARWLAAPAGGRLRAAPAPPARWPGLRQALRRHRWQLTDDRAAAIPESAIYLNVAQYGFEHPVFFRWLERRPDITPVFFIHDLLPLDAPEYFREGYRDLFLRRVATMARHAKGAIVSTEVVAARLRADMRQRGRADLPILVAALPPPSRPVEQGPTAADGPASAPYFVMTGTIEPRKNHLLILNVWRDLVRAGGPVPRLVLVGPRGWDNEQVLDLLDRSRLLAPHVAEVSGLGTGSMRQLVAQARAVLMPSFEEGYGLPLAEALAEGTPVLASDIPVFREVSQGRARLLDPTDGPGWRAAIAVLTSGESDLRRSMMRDAADYAAMAWPCYFREVLAFFAGL